MTTRCKFYCVEVKKMWNSYSKEFTYEARFTAVTDGSEENKSFFKYTSSGVLTVAVYKEDIFTPGKSYYLDITECEY